MIVMSALILSVSSVIVLVLKTLVYVKFKDVNISSGFIIERRLL